MPLLPLAQELWNLALAHGAAFPKQQVVGRIYDQEGQGHNARHRRSDSQCSHAHHRPLSKARGQKSARRSGNRQRCLWYHVLSAHTHKHCSIARTVTQQTRKVIYFAVFEVLLWYIRCCRACLYRRGAGVGALKLLMAVLRPVYPCGMLHSMDRQSETREKARSDSGSSACSGEKHPVTTERAALSVLLSQADSATGSLADLFVTLVCILDLNP